MEIAVTPQFRRQFKKLSLPLQEEAHEKIAAFADTGNHDALRVHKLKGALNGFWSFSVNYRYRIVFAWEHQHESAVLLSIGDHRVYD